MILWFASQLWLGFFSTGAIYLSPDGYASFIIGCTRKCKNSTVFEGSTEQDVLPTAVHIEDCTERDVLPTAVHIEDSTEQEVLSSDASIIPDHPPILTRIRVPRRKAAVDIPVKESPVEEDDASFFDASDCVVGSVQTSSISLSGDEIPDMTTDDESML
jgi:hypothetical protein